MTLRRRVLLGLIALLAALVIAAAWYLGPIAPIATGYAAKTVCSGHFVSGRPAVDVLEDLPANPLVPFLRVATDDTEGVTTATLMGLWGSTAWHGPYGCTLSADRPTFPGPGPEPIVDGRPWPAGDRVEVAAPPAVDGGALEAAIDRAFAEGDLAGRRRNTRAVVVVKDGQIVAERYAPGFTADTPLLGWSMTKSVANAMVGRLAASGSLAVDDDRLVPTWDDGRARITLGQLLQMRSGLAFEEVYDPDTDATRMLFTPRDTGAYAAAQPLVAEPGSAWSYSSGTTNIVCDVLHEVSGLGPRMAYDLVFEPLGMGSAVIEPDETGGLVCSSFMYATARDWATFGLWFLQDGIWEGSRLLPAGWVDYSTQPVAAALDPENPYGAHWWLNRGADGDLRMPSVPADAYWASGNEGQHVVVIPSAGAVVVRLGLTQGFDGIDWGLEPLLRGVLDAIGEG